MHSGASSAAYTALRAELITLDTADMNSSSFTGEGTMDIDGRAGATGVAVARGPLANGDIYLTSTAALGGIRKASSSDPMNPTMPADETTGLLNGNGVLGAKGPYTSSTLRQRP
jgi:hypothetical protein